MYWVFVIFSWAMLKRKKETKMPAADARNFLFFSILALFHYHIYLDTTKIKYCSNHIGMPSDFFLLIFFFDWNSLTILIDKKINKLYFIGHIRLAHCQTRQYELFKNLSILIWYVWQIFVMILTCPLGWRVSMQNWVFASDQNVCQHNKRAICQSRNRFISRHQVNRHI